MSARRKIAKNTLIQVVGKIITASSTILVTMLVTRHFGPAGFGEFTVMITFPTLFWIAVDFGFNQIAVREISRDPNKSQSYFSNLLLLRLGLAAFFTPIALTILAFLPYSPAIKLGAGLNLGTLFLMSFFSSTQVLFQANLAYGFQVASQVSGALLNLGLVFILTYLEKSIIYIALSSLFGNFLMAAVAAAFASRFVSFRKVEWDRPLAKSLLAATLPVGLALIFNVFDFKVDSLMLSVLPLPGGASNSEAVGYYGTAFKILEVALTIPFFFMSASYPVLVQKLKESRLEASKFFLEILGILLGLSVLGLLGGLVLAPLMIRFLAGPNFTASVPVLRVLFLALPIFYLSSPFMYALLALEEQGVLPWIYSGATVLNVFLNAVFIPHYSYFAAAAITGVTEFFVLLCLAYFVVPRLFCRKEAFRKVRKDPSFPKQEG